MMKVEDEAGVREEGEHALDVLAREGARRMIAAALEVEVEDYPASRTPRRTGARRGRAQRAWSRPQGDDRLGDRDAPSAAR